MIFYIPSTANGLEFRFKYILIQLKHRGAKDSLAIGVSGEMVFNENVDYLVTDKRNKFEIQIDEFKMNVT